MTPLSNLLPAHSFADGPRRTRALGLVLLLALLVALLTACGGGGGGSSEGDGATDPANLPLLPTITQDVLPAGERIDVSARHFFPMTAGDSWQYDRIEDARVTGYVVRKVVGEPAADGSLLLSELDSTEDEVAPVSELYRTTGDGVWLADPFGAKGVYPGLYDSLPSLLEYPTPFYPVGGVRSLIRQGGIAADVDGDGKADYYRVEITQVFRGFESIQVMGIETAVAHFSNQLLLTIRTTGDDVARTMTATEEAYFADNIGLVRSDRAASDASGAAVIRPYRLQLIRAAVSGRAYPSGLVWRERASGTANTLFAITSSSTQAVAVGALGTIVTSGDGRAWTPRLSGVAFHLNGVATSGSTFIAVGDAGTIVRSVDLSTWVVQPSGTTLRLLAVTWTGRQFVAVGEAGTVLTSADGTVWDPQVSGTSEHLRAVAGHGSVIVAGGDGAALLSSPDGISWTPRTLGGTTHGLIWSGTQFLAVGEFGSPGFGETRATSFDGITWTKRQGGWGNALLGAAWSGGAFVAVGPFGVSVTSSDGVAWAVGGEFSFSGQLNGLTWFKDEFIAIGSGGTLLAALAPLSVPATLFDIESTGAQVLAVGALGTIRTSADGTTWQARASGVSLHLHGVSATGPRFVAVGEFGTVLSSEDMGVWTLRPSGTTQRLRAVAWTGNRFVVVGDGGVVLSSPDGLSWTAESSGVISDLHGVAGDTGLVIAVGADSVLLRSTPGTAWTPQVSVAGTVLHDVVWSGHQFLVAGNNPNGLTPTVQTSFDGIVWTARSGAIGNEALGAAWSGQRFATVGTTSAAQTSSDGITWTLAANASASASLHGVTWHLDRFLAVGDFGQVISIP